MIIFVSDHGEEMGEHGGWQHDHTVYEEQLRVPLIIRFPGGRYAGRRVTEVVCLVDLAPTIFDYLQRPDLAAGMRGRSLMPLVRGDSAPEPPELCVTAMRMNRKKYYRPYKETRGDSNFVVRDDRWKGILNAEVGTFELYDLAEDPLERVELSAQQPERAAAMRDYLEVFCAECFAGAKEATTGGLDELDEETLERLRSLGYVD